MGLGDGSPPAGSRGGRLFAVVGSFRCALEIPRHLWHLGRGGATWPAFNPPVRQCYLSLDDWQSEQEGSNPEQYDEFLGVRQRADVASLHRLLYRVVPTRTQHCT